MALNKQFSKEQMRAAQQRFLHRQSQPVTHKTPKMLSEELLRTINGELTSPSSSLTNIISALNSASIKHKQIIMNLWKLSKLIPKHTTIFVQEVSRARSFSLSSLKYNSDDETQDETEETYDDFKSAKVFKPQCVEILEIIRKYCLSRRAGLRICALRCLSLLLTERTVCSEAYVQRLDQTIIKCMDYVARKQEETDLIFKCIQKWMHVMKEDTPFCLIFSLIANTENSHKKQVSKSDRSGCQTGQNLSRISMSLLSEYMILAPEFSSKRGVFEHVAIKIFKPTEFTPNTCQSYDITDFENLELESISFALCTLDKPPFNIMATAISVILHQSGTLYNTAQRITQVPVCFLCNSFSNTVHLF